METECPDIWPCSRVLPDGFEPLDTACVGFGLVVVNGNWDRWDRYYKNIGLFYLPDPYDNFCEPMFFNFVQPFREWVEEHRLTEKELKAGRDAGLKFQCCPVPISEEEKERRLKEKIEKVSKIYSKT